MILLTLVPLLAGLREPAPAPAPPGPVLQRVDDDWWVTGYAPQTAGYLQRGRLLVALRPVPGTADARPAAVLRVVEALATSAKVGTYCAPPETALQPGLSVVPLGADHDAHVGKCLAHVLDEGRDGAAWVLLSVGADDGVAPGDRYRLLGLPVVQEGFVPLAFDTARDGECVIPQDRTHLGALSARCLVPGPPPGGGSWKGKPAVYAPPEGP